jgi:predicted nucleic acid-binding Zn ribbon protein
VCGKPIPLSENFCSPACENIFAERQKKVVKTRKFLYGIFIIFILIWLFVVLKGRL